MAAAPNKTAEGVDIWNAGEVRYDLSGGPNLWMEGGLRRSLPNCSGHIVLPGSCC